MRVLVACEFSGVVRDAFLARGHDAMSVDLLPSERPGPHYQGNIIDFLETSRDGWDLMVAHPPCTYLANSGVRWLYGGKGHVRDRKRWNAMITAAEFFAQLLNAPIARIAIENPVMHRYAREIIEEDLRPGLVYAKQTVQPYEYGHPDSKRTGLWLKNLPLLVPTNVLPVPESGHWSNQTPSGQNRLGPSPTRWAERSRTYEGIAAAMAEQWGALDISAA